MSNKKHRGTHGQRAETRAHAQTSEAVSKTNRAAATAYKPRRVYLRNWMHIWATVGVLAAVVAVLIIFEMQGWWDTVIGSVLSVLVGAFGCMCLYDTALLLTEALTFGEGMVNAGKNSQGQAMIFHAASVTHLEVRDKADNALPADARIYKNAELCFIMESGRINRRPVSRLTQKQLSNVREALEAEKSYKNTP